MCAPARRTRSRAGPGPRAARPFRRPASEKGARLAQKMQVGPCVPVGIQLHLRLYKRLKSVQLLGQPGVFLTPLSCAIDNCPHRIQRGAAEWRQRPRPGGPGLRTAPTAWPAYLKKPHIATRTRPPARAGTRRKGRLGALRAHTKAPYEIDFHRKTLMGATGA